MKLTDYLVGALERYGIRDIFMLTGGGCMHLVDSVGRSKKIKFTCCHHEQACAMAAEAYAKYTNKIAVVLVTSGPGSTNTLTGLAGAYQDSTPCLFISGQAKKKQTVYNAEGLKLRQFGVQEVNIIPVVQPLTKYAIMLNEPEKIRYYLEKALYIAQHGRPGPVWLDIPLDVQSASVDKERLTGFSPEKEGLANPFSCPKDALDKIVKYFHEAQRPVIISGHGVRIAGACRELESFVSQFEVPVVTPFLGIDVIPSSHRCYIGRVGTKGTRAGNFAMQNADLLISIGSRLSVSVVGHEYNLFAPAAKVVVVDIDTQEHQKKTIAIDTFINADAKDFLRRFSIALKGKRIASHSNWLNRCRGWKKKYPVCLAQYRKKSGRINLYYFMEVLNKKNTAGLAVISDAGSVFYAVSQALDIKRRQRYITSGALATMGFSIPAAIGVSIAEKSGPVVAITGDGSFQQNIQELQTIVHHRLPVKIFVINNEGYLSIRQTQERFFNGRLVGEGKSSGLSFPSLKKISSAYGITYFRADNSSVEKVLTRIMKSNGPVICEVSALVDQQIIPTNTAQIRPDGTMVSKPLEDMYPFLDREEFLANMLVKPCDE